MAMPGHDAIREPMAKKQKKRDTDATSLIEAAGQRLAQLQPDDPVLSLEFDNSGKLAPTVDPASSPSCSLLGSMVFPISPEIFMKSCFRRKALHIGGANHDGRIQNLIERYMFNLEPDSILRETSSENLFIWLIQQCNRSKEKATVATSQRLIRSIEVSDPDTACALHQAGHATYCRAPPKLEQLLVSKLLRDTGMGCGQYDPSGERTTVLGRGEVEVFIGTEGHVTNWHYDFQENFTIQLSGTKRWTLRQGTVKHPIRGCTPHYASPEVVESQLKAARLSDPKFQFETPSSNNSVGHDTTVLLRPGNVLYFPAGMWHKVETVEPGVSINVSLMATNYAALTCQALHHLLLQSDRWREEVVNIRDEKAEAVGDSNSAVAKLKLLLQELPDIVSKFEQAGGAEAILPPVLCRAPAFQQTGEEEEREMEEEAAHVTASDDEKVETETAELGLDSGDLGEIIDIPEFELPEDWSPDPPGENHHLVRNPLASLIRMQDITQFYADRNCDDIYVLNVNYAGNEMHESAIRLVLRDPSHLLRDFGKWPQTFKIASCKTVPSILIFHGYYQWVKSNDHA